MNDSQPVSPRARLQALQAIPERQRTDAEWDELNELEIALAAGNRQGAPQQGAPQHGAQQQGGRGNNPGGQPRPGGGGQQNQGRRQGKRFHHHRGPKRNAP